MEVESDERIGILYIVSIKNAINISYSSSVDEFAFFILIERKREIWYEPLQMYSRFYSTALTRQHGLSCKGRGVSQTKEHRLERAATMAWLSFWDYILGRQGSWVLMIILPLS